MCIIEEVEAWKDVFGYEGCYQVSSIGRVKSLRRIVYNYVGYYYIDEKILKQTKLKNGYLFVGLSLNGIRKTHAVHQLVAVAFMNHRPDGFNSVIDHKDLNKLNNRIENLKIISNRENTSQKHIPHSSKYTGVSWNKSANRWHAQIRYKKQRIHIGFFKEELDAGLAYERELKLILTNKNYHHVKI